MDSSDRPVSPTYQLVMLVLCVYALGVLAAETTIRLAPSTRGILDYADYAVCAVFFADFLLSLARAPNRWRYLITWGWLDLLSSLPTTWRAWVARLESSACSGSFAASAPRSCSPR